MRHLPVVDKPECEVCGRTRFDPRPMEWEGVSIILCTDCDDMLGWDPNSFQALSAIAEHKRAKEPCPPESPRSSEGALRPLH